MAGSNILVIDGDFASRNYLALALQKEGHHILQASSGKEGLISAWRDRPDLIIADPLMADLTAEQLAGRLRSDARTTKVPLIALSSDTNPGRARSCKDAGFNAYLVKNAQVLPSLIETVNRLLGGPVVVAKEGGYSMVFLSAKGGTGTSSLCANIAMNIADAQPETQVVVVDMVLPIGSIAGIVGYVSDQNLVTISEQPAAETTPEYFRNALKEIDVWRFHLLAGSTDPDQSNELVIGRIGDIVSILKSTYDFVLLDLGRGLSRISLPLIEHADLIAMIVGSDLSSVNLSKIVWDYLQARDVQAASVYAFLNRSIGFEGLTKPEAEKIIGLPIKSVLPFLGANLAMANDQHQPYSVKFPRDTASIVLREAARQMVSLAKSLRPS
jgi:CheY-like chemotaxis protein/MinD-like ATPase involved in chromosome partitioning or flagellar assembly